MPEVTVRDAQPDDAAAIGEIWALAMPHLVRTAARAASDLREDATLTRRRWVGLVDGQVAGTATGRDHGNGRVSVTVEVHPDLAAAASAAPCCAPRPPPSPTPRELTAVCNDDPISLAFAVRTASCPSASTGSRGVDPRTVPPASGRRPGALRAARSLDEVADLQLLLDTHNASADDDPERPSRSVYTWSSSGPTGGTAPTTPPSSSSALLDESGADAGRRRVHQRAGRPDRAAGRGAA